MSILAYPGDVRFTPDSDGPTDIPDRRLCANRCREQVQQTAALFDHPFGGEQQPWRNFQTQCSGGLAIDVERKFGGALNREFAWLGSLENAVNISCRLAEL